MSLTHNLVLYGIFAISVIVLLPSMAYADVWIPDSEFLSYIDSNGIFTVVGKIKNSEESPVIPTVIINIQDGNKMISKSFEYVTVYPSTEFPFKFKFPEISKSASLLKPDLAFVPVQEKPTRVEVLYDKTLIIHDDGHLTGRIINKGDSAAHNVKILAIVRGYEKALDVAQNIKMIEKIEPGEIKTFEMYPDPSITSEISYYSCFAPTDSTIIPVTTIRNGEKFFFRYDTGTSYYDIKFNEEGTELSMNTINSFPVQTYASFEFPYYTDNEEFSVFLNGEPKEFIQSIDEMGNWHVSFTVEPRERGNLVIKGFANGWKPSSDSYIPDWIRTIAKLWSEDEIGDGDFTTAMQFLLITHNHLANPFQY